MTSSTPLRFTMVERMREGLACGPQYGPGYYAAFVGDLDGYKIEAVCHET